MKKIILIVFIVLFSGCTKEYMAERSKCNDLAYSEYPQQMEQRIGKTLHISWSARDVRLRWKQKPPAIPD